MTFDERLAAVSARVGRRLDEAMSAFGSDSVAEGMRYAAAGGKRLRGYLVVASAELSEEPRAGHLSAAAAIECLHAYSLVHDDLPAMDDDDLRRGQPTVHRKWDEATAILVGDALQSLAFELLGGSEVHGDPGVRIELIASLARASGAAGMVLGQAQDIAAETAGRKLTLDEITELQANKTGALIRWSAEAGARLAGREIEPMTRYADALGLAFQIADDILDETGDEAKAGKRLKKDARAGKATFVSILGLDGARAKARDLVAEAIDALAPYGAGADPLREAARFVISREF